MGVFKKSKEDPLKKSLTPFVVGNVLEFYDLGIYGFLAPVMMSSFFPDGDLGSRLLITCAVFAIGFLARPIGSIVFGHLGDTVGRKHALSYTILFMSICTFLIGSLPTHGSIGIWAPILLVLTRFFQGMCAGGEYNGSVIFVFESLCKKNYGLYGSILTASAVSGFLLASFVSYLTCKFLGDSLQWRVPFWLGSFLGIIGFYIRHHFMESPSFLKTVEEKKTHALPFLKVFQQDMVPVLCTFGIAWGLGGFSMTLIGYTNIYVNQVLGLSLQDAMTASITGLISFVVFLPIGGILSDRFGHTRFMKATSVANAFMIILVFYLFSFKSLSLILVAQVLFAMGTAAFSGPMHIVMIQLFPVQRRYSGVSFSYSLGLALFGGFAPTMNTFLINNTQSVQAPSFYLSLCACVGFLAVYVAGKRKKYSFDA